MPQDSRVTCSRAFWSTYLLFSVGAVKPILRTRAYVPVCVWRYQLNKVLIVTVGDKAVYSSFVYTFLLFHCAKTTELTWNRVTNKYYSRYIVLSPYVKAIIQNHASRNTISVIKYQLGEKCDNVWPTCQYRSRPSARKISYEIFGLGACS